MNTLDTALEQLLINRKSILCTDLRDYEWEKISGNSIPGCKVLISWIDRTEKDTGYCFVLPGIGEPDECDVFIHVPQPDNSNGMGASPEVFIHAQDLMTNSEVTKIEFLKHE